MGSEFSIQVQGDRQVLQVLAQLRGNLEDMTPAWQEAADELAARADRRFETKTDPAGNPWTPWSKRTRRLREKEGRGSLLEHTGLMRASLHGEGRKDGLVLGLGRSYAPYHETGTSRMPRRGIFLAQVDPEPALAPGDSQVVLDILMGHLAGGGRG